MNVDMDSIVVEIESSTKKASEAIDSLISKLNELQTSLSSVGKASNTFKNIGKTIASNTKISPIKNIGLSDQLEKLQVSLNKDDIVSKFTSTTSAGVTTEITKYKDELGNVINVQKKMRDGMDDYYRVTKKTSSEQTTAFDKFKNSLAGIVTKTTLLVVGAKKLLSTMIELTETSAEYTEAVNLFYTEMGDKAQEAEEWVKKFSTALYLDPSDVMRYMGAFHELTKGIGIGADNAYKMSKNMTQLVYDFSSFANISEESAYDKLISAISGQIKGVKAYGVALSQNTLQELANELGIKQRVTTMNEASKAQLRYIQIMRSSTNWHADLGKTMMSTENILKSARQQWTLMTRALGNIAAVIVRQLMPYFVALTQLIQEAAVSLANFFGLKINFADDFKKNSKSVGVNIENIKDGIEDIGDGADKTRKKLNTMLAPFDDLNVVQTKVEKSGSGDSGALSSLGDLPLPEYDALAKLTGEWSGKIGEAKEKMKSMIPVIKAVAVAMGTIWTVKKISDFVLLLSRIKTSFGLLGKVVTAFSTKLGLSTGAALGTLALILAGIVYNITLIVKVTEPLNKMFNNIKNSTDGLIGSFGKLSLKEKITTILALMAPLSRAYIVLKTIKEVIDEIKSGKSIGDIFQEWFPGISNFTKNAYNNVKDFVTKTYNKITSVFSSIGKWFNDKVIVPIKDVFSPLYDWFSELFSNIGNTIKDVFDVGIGLIKGTITTAKLLFKAGKDWLMDTFIKPVANTFASIWEGIKNGAKIAWDGIKMVFSPVANFFGDIFSKAWEKVKKVFSVGGKIFDGIKEGIETAFKKIVNKIISGINTIVSKPFDAINSMLNKIRSVSVLGVKPFENLWDKNPISVPKIPTFETGGYPDKASLFWANENGIPEMVGQIGNQTAVANNDQITTSITNALIAALSGMNFGGQGTTVVNIGNKKVYEGMGEYLDGESERYGTSYVNI